MTETDLSDWLPIAEAALLIGCSTRTVERLARAKKLEQRLRPQAGSPAVAVYNPEDVARMRSERRPAPAPFVLPAVPANGNGKSGTLAHVTPSHIPGVIPGEDLIRGLAVLISKALQSPPSPPVAESHGGETLFLTIAEASAIAGLSQADVRRAIEAGELAARKTGRGSYRVRRRDLELL